MALKIAIGMSVKFGNCPVLSAVACRGQCDYLNDHPAPSLNSIIMSRNNADQRRREVPLGVVSGYIQTKTGQKEL